MFGFNSVVHKISALVDVVTPLITGVYRFSAKAKHSSSRYSVRNAIEEVTNLLTLDPKKLFDKEVSHNCNRDLISCYTCRE